MRACVQAAATLLEIVQKEEAHPLAEILFQCALGVREVAQTSLPYTARTVHKQINTRTPTTNEKCSTAPDRC